jgi:aldehyde:ferredoxin oxidoreductase
MEHGGFVGKILFVDLTTGKIRKEPLDLQTAGGLLGGFGVDLKLLYELLPPGTDPLAPENPIIIGAGPLVGTLTPGSPKVTFTAKRPIYASATQEDKHGVMVGTAGTVRFGFMLKNAGYDHIVITGKANSPAFLKIVNDEVEVCDATDLWGRMDAYQTTDELTRRYGRCGIYAIGPASENLVRLSIGTVDGHYSLGKAGGGAIMGSKNLKAIVVYGNKGVRVADPKRLMAVYDDSRKRITENPGFKDIARYGTPSFGAMAHLAGRDWRAFWGKYWKLVDSTRVANASCISCLTPCRAIMELKEGRFAGLRLVRRAFPISTPTRPVPEGSIDYGPGLKVEDAIERPGLDRQNALQIVNFVSMLYERGEISKEDTGGLVLKQRDFWDPDIDSTVQLIERIANKEGDFARCLGEGWNPVSERFGVDASAVMSLCKGCITILDARKARLQPSIFVQITGPGVHHMHFAGHFPGIPIADIKANGESMGMSQEEVNRAFTAEEFDTGRMAKHVEDYYAVEESLGICSLPAQLHSCHSIASIAEYYSAMTGFETSPRELKLLGEKVWNMYKLLNVREGFNRKDDMLPSWWKAADDNRLLDYWGRTISRDKLEGMLDHYYSERGWDVKSGIPTGAKLSDLALGEFKDILLDVKKRENAHDI